MKSYAGEIEAVFESLEARSASQAPPVRRIGRAAVLGAGPVGQAVACELLAAGVEVSLWSAFGEQLGSLATSGSLTVRGAHLVGTYRLDGSTAQPHIRLAGGIDDAVAEADAVFVATPATAHATYAGLLAGVLRDGQILALVPARAFGAAEVLHVLRRHDVRARVTLVEVASAPYLVDAPAPGQLRIHAAKVSVAAAAIPNRDTPEAVATLSSALPMLIPALGVLSTTFSDVAGLVHALPHIVTAGCADGSALTLRDVLSSDHVRTLLRALDSERIAVAFAYGVRELPRLDRWLGEAYGIDAQTLEETLLEMAPYAQLPAAGGGVSLRDSVASSLVPLISAGLVAGVPTPASRAVTELASVILGGDLLRHGRTLERVGLEGLSPDEVRRSLEAPRAG